MLRQGDMSELAGMVKFCTGGGASPDEEEFAPWPELGGSCRIAKQNPEGMIRGLKSRSSALGRHLEAQWNSSHALSRGRFDCLWASTGLPNDKHEARFGSLTVPSVRHGMRNHYDP